MRWKAVAAPMSLPMILEAISVGPLAACILDARPNGCIQGRVMARFERSAYVAVDGELVCITDPALYDGAINMRCRRLPAAGADVWLDGRSARRWHPDPWPSPDCIQGCMQLVAGRCRDVPVASGGLSLLGRGEGLTPDGDDIIAGMMLAWRAVGARFDATPVLAAAAERTHAISLAHLRAAAHGYASAPVHAALAALLDPEYSYSDLAPAMAGLDAVGHSSGRSTLTGIKQALVAWAADPTACMKV
ncbi:MAG: DUF2877 domain-containing protein [Geminicoccaceae bacterium]|nr:DUF2877 domain-containing protein [Geminicoccaceae bacterium]